MQGSRQMYLSPIVASATNHCIDGKLCPDVSKAAQKQSEEVGVSRVRVISRPSQLALNVRLVT